MENFKATQTDDISKCLRNERYGTPMAVTYSEKGKTQCAVGVFFEIAGDCIDLRTHTAQVMDLSKVPENYTVLKIPVEDILGYTVLKAENSVVKSHPR